MDSDKKFEAFQELRRGAEQSARDAITRWAFAEGVDALTVAQLKGLSEMVVHMTNRAARDAFELGRS